MGFTMNRMLALIILSVMAITTANAGWDEGVAAFSAKDYETAAAEFQTVIYETPEAPQGHYMLGLTLQQLKRAEEALTHLRKAYDLSPNDTSFALSLGRAYYSVRRYGDAASVLAPVDVTALPSQQQILAYQIRGQSFYQTDNLSSAADDFEQLARLKPDDLTTQSTYGTVAYGASRFEKAIGALRRATELAAANSDPGDDAPLWKQLGYAYEKNGQYTEAIQAYQTAGDQEGVARAKQNEETARYNAKVEAENAEIEKMKEEARQLEEELRRLEEGSNR